MTPTSPSQHYHGRTDPPPPATGSADSTPTPATPPTTQLANVYRFTVTLQSRIKMNFHRGDATIVIAQNPQAAAAMMQAYYGSDLVRLEGPVLAEQGVLTTMTGS